jgi:hypothetical protein
MEQIELTQKELVAHLRERVSAAGTLRACAKELGISIAYLHDVVRSKREPGDKILKAIYFRRKVTFVYDPSLAETPATQNQEKGI